MYRNNKPTLYAHDKKIFVVFGECCDKSTKQTIKAIKVFYNFKNKFYNSTGREVRGFMIKDCYYQKIKL